MHSVVIGFGMAAEPPQCATCIVVNGPSSAGKSTLCAALQDRLIDVGLERGGKVPLFAT